MTATTRFIEDAIKGGWRSDIPEHQHQSFIDGKQGDIRFMLLDPQAWQAVGKTRVWNKCTMYSFSTGKAYSENVWLYNMHRFIDALADGKDIEEALQAIE